MQTTFNRALQIFGLLFLITFSAAAQTMPVTPVNQLTLPAGNYTVPFRWQGDTLNTLWEPYASLLVPVQLPHCPKVFYMQFDSGSPYSLFYRNKLKAIRQRYPRTFAPGDSLMSLRNFVFKVADQNIAATEMAVRQFHDSNIDWKKNSVEIIGTIGVDFIDNKTLVIDYVQGKLFIGNELPAAISPELVAFDFHYAGKRILLPVQIKDRKTILYFDSGSSAFTLLTDKATCTSLAAPDAVPARYAVKSWNKVLIANTLKSNDSITVASANLPLNQVTYMEGVSDAQVKQMMQMGIGGMTGNKLFLRSILVLDTRNKKFGVIAK